MAQNREVGSISEFRTWHVYELKPGLGIHHFDKEYFYDVVQIAGVVPSTKLDSAALTLFELGKSIRVNSADDEIIIFPSVGEDEDGALIELVRIGTGKVTGQTSDGDKLGSDDYTKIYNEVVGERGVILFEYVHAITTWIIRSSFATWVPEA